MKNRGGMGVRGGPPVRNLTKTVRKSPQQKVETYTKFLGETVKKLYFTICITEYKGIHCNGNRKGNATGLGHRKNPK
jgi:hypothetical protein